MRLRMASPSPSPPPPQGITDAESAAAAPYHPAVESPRANVSADVIEEVSPAASAMKPKALLRELDNFFDSPVAASAVTAASRPASLSASGKAGQDHSLCCGSAAVTNCNRLWHMEQP